MSSLISSNEIKARHFHSPRRFIDDLCAINDGGEFERSICEIYPKEPEHKVENQGDHATLLNLDIIIKEETFIYKLFDKRDSFPFFNCKNTSYRKQYPAKYILFSNQR